MSSGIRCGHCGDRHATVAEVRSCDGALAGDARSTDEATDASTSSARPQPAADVVAVVLAPDWTRLAGPAPLGRSVVVTPGAEAPSPWTDAERIAVDGATTDAATLDRLQTAWSTRTPVVIELTGELPPDNPILDVDYWQLAPDSWLTGERLRHLVLANSIDARSPAEPTFAPVSVAVTGGVALASADGDVVGPDGSPVWCDGGPLDRFDGELEGRVVPSAHLALGSSVPLRTAEPAAELASDQLAAVAHRRGGARIIAPAGSGKTRVLTERARFLVKGLGVDPRAVCLVAFNVRAREEMQERLADVDGLEIRTLNSLALAITAGRSPFAPSGRSARVIDERDVRRHLDQLVRVRRQAMADPFAVWIEALTASRLGLRSPTEVERDFGGDVKGFAEVLPEYRAALRRRGEVDFDEQILGAIDVLLTDPNARRVARQVCQVLLVDEFQDLTPAHVLLVRLLAGPAADVFGVGDDDQTIYGYSGASPDWLIDFTDLFPGSGTHDLHVNYRCPPEVVRAAGTLLTHNHRRIDKTITARPDRSDRDGALGVASSPDPTVELVEHVQARITAGVRPADIAVLTRVNATLLAPMIALHEAGIATSAPVDDAFLSRTGVQGALAWLRLATGPERRLNGPDIDVAARRPPRGLSRRLVEWMSEQSSPKDLLALAGRLREERDTNKVSDFVDDLTSLRARADDGATTHDLLVAVRDDTGLGGALDNRLDASRRSVDRSAHGDDLAALIAIARFEPDPAAFPDWLGERLREASNDWAGVRLSTVHRVKGREWPHVIVYEATAGLFPHRLAADREEERRVFHVAITRGSDSVLVLGTTPASPFVAQLSEPRDPDAEPEPVLDLRTAAPAPSPRRPEIAEPATPEEAELRDRLRAWRKVRSQQDSVPAYVVFSDATLADLSSRRPSDHRGLLAVHGIGPAKVDRYGDALLELIADD